MTESEKPTGEVYFTIEEASYFLNLKISRIRYEVFKKTIPFLKIGRSIRFSENDLYEWMRNKKQQATQLRGRNEN